VLVHTLPDAFVGPWTWPNLRDLVETVFFPERAPPTPPMTWREAARDSDVLAVPGLQVAYWGRPDAPYGGKVTRNAKAPVAVIVHFTDETPIATLVEYGHRPDPNRGNAAYGYHLYIDRVGRILQGAPLSVRTNHVKPSHASERIGGTVHLDGANTISVSLIGACRSPPLSPVTYRCSEERPTAAQIESGLAVIAALQQRFSIPCAAVFGHGDLQTDRKSFEGATLTQRHRRRCG
jgi:Fe-S cluster biogenesis protein NfuA